MGETSLADTGRKKVKKVRIVTDEGRNVRRKKAEAQRKQSRIRIVGHVTGHHRRLLLRIVTADPQCWKRW